MKGFKTNRIIKSRKQSKNCLTTDPKGYKTELKLPGPLHVFVLIFRKHKTNNSNLLKFENLNNKKIVQFYFVSPLHVLVSTIIIHA